jgi:CHASE3 domain sensor protein
MKDVIDTVTRMKQQRQSEAKQMLKEASIICGTIIVLAVIIIVVGVRIA